MGLEASPKRQKRHRDFLKRQERRWAKKSGPVTVRFVDPATLRPGSGPARGAAQPGAPAAPDAGADAGNDV
jgi:hypothetical protein